MSHAGKNATNSGKRILFLDSMRSILMMLGVVLHSAMIFNPQDTWLIQSENESALLGYLVNIIHWFRMPAFFMVSGFLTAMLLQKYGSRAFLQSRSNRLLVPLLFGSLVLNSVVTMLLVNQGWRSSDLSGYLRNSDEWLQHLWFLRNLLVYMLIVYALGRFRYLHPTLRAFSDRLGGVPVLMTLCMLPVLSVLVPVISRLGVPVYFSAYGLDMYSILSWLPFFAFGAALFFNRSVFDALLYLDQWKVMLFFGCSTLLVMVLPEPQGVFDRSVEIYLQSLSVWFAVVLCTQLFFRFCDKPSRLWRYLSDASYSVYLMHQLFVVVLGMFVIRAGMPAYIGFPILVLATIALTLWIHNSWISTSAVVRFVVNGKFAATPEAKPAGARDRDSLRERGGKSAD